MEERERDRQTDRQIKSQNEKDIVRWIERHKHSIFEREREKECVRERDRERHGDEEK
jgi:hypothetical protein